MILSLKLLFHFVITNTPGQILINEILFNPKAQGVDFVELYNNSNQIIDLQQIYIANLNNQQQRASSIKVSEISRPFYPGTYCVLTVSPDIVHLHYKESRPESFIKMSRMPAFNNETGTVLILYRPTDNEKNLPISQWTLLDSLSYHTSMHSSFIKNSKGISLERQHMLLPTNHYGNFKSAAVQSGGGTPGLINSSAYQANQNITLKSKILSPDNDGYEDELVVQYNISHQGLMANLLIYNNQGKLIKSLIKNTSIGSHGQWTWDGQTDRGNTALPGIYTLYIELYNGSGFRMVRRKSFVLTLRN